ncbi:hypothetical protein [Fontivita pretiosa]
MCLLAQQFVETSKEEIKQGYTGLIFMGLFFIALIFLAIWWLKRSA